MPPSNYPIFCGFESHQTEKMSGIIQKLQRFQWTIELVYFGLFLVGKLLRNFNGNPVYNQNAAPLDSIFVCAVNNIKSQLYIVSF
jgi:hypothetical protein